MDRGKARVARQGDRVREGAHRDTHDGRAHSSVTTNGCVNAIAIFGRWDASHARAPSLDAGERLLAARYVDIRPPGDVIAARHRRCLRSARPLHPRRRGQDDHGTRVTDEGRRSIRRGVGARERGHTGHRRARRDATDATGDGDDGREGRPSDIPGYPRGRRRGYPRG